MPRIEVIVAVFGALSIHCSAAVSYRLPNDSLPLSYDLWLTTDIHRGDSSYSGRVKIQILIKEATNTVTLHSREIAVESVDLLYANGTLKRSSLQVEPIEELDFIRVDLNERYNASDELVLDFSFRGNLTDDTDGFVRTFFISRDFRQEWMALSHFEPISARRAFVCYDEPHIKAPFKLQIRHDKGYEALSNMPISRTIDDASSYVTSVFEETPPMPTFVLAFIVSKLGHVSNNRSDFEQRIYGDPEKINNGTAQFALTVVNEVVEKLSEILAMPIQVPKLDHIALPLNNLAAQHFGLITYEESFLLIDEAFDQVVIDYYKPIIIAIITHEIAHQYFADLVTPAWWSHVWLSEGFATFYQYYLPHVLYPQYDYMEKFRGEVVGFALAIDDSEGAMNDYVESPVEIHNKFQPVAYEKTAAVLRMFYEALGSGVFSEGIKLFLSDNKFTTVTPEDLHRALQSAYDRVNQGKYLDIGKLMSSWEDQPGFPVVSVMTNGSSVIFTQQKFNDRQSASIFSIPITFTTKSTSKPTQIWLTTRSQRIDNVLTADTDWILLNTQQVGYYRTDYSRELWQSIIQGYPNGMHRINRELLHEEIHIAWQTLETATACDCVRLLGVLAHESDGGVWEKAEYIEELQQFVLFSDVYPHFQELLRSVLEPHMHVLTETMVLDTKLLEQVTKWGRVALHRTYLQHELDKLLEYMATDDSELRPDFCSALRTANASVYDVFVEEVLHFESFIDMELVFGLGCSLDAQLLSDMFGKVLDPANEMSQWIVLDVFRTTVEASEIGLMTVMTIIEENFADIYELSDSIIEQVITFTHLHINSDSHLQRFKSLTQTLVDNDIITSALRTSMIASIEAKLQASEWRELRICFGLDEEQTSSTFEAETTTQGAVVSSSSIRLIASCILLYSLVNY